MALQSDMRGANANGCYLPILMPVFIGENALLKNRNEQKIRQEGDRQNPKAAVFRTYLYLWAALKWKAYCQRPTSKVAQWFYSPFGFDA